MNFPFDWHDLKKFLESKEFLITMGVITTVVCIAAGIYLIRKYREMQWGKCKSLRRMSENVRKILFLASVP